MSSVKYLTFTEMQIILDANSANPAIQINMPLYRETYTALQINKEGYLEKLLAEFADDKNILYTSMENIIMHPSLRVINMEEFFDKLDIVFLKFINQMNNILCTNNKSNFYFYGFQRNKSNFWLCLLFVKYISKPIYTYLHKHIFIIGEDSDITFEPDYTNYYITLDDCSYSGRQLEQAITSVNKTNYNQIICVLPFISSIAYNLLKRYDAIIIYEEIILSVRDDISFRNTLIDNTLILVNETEQFFYSNHFLHYFQETYLPVIFEHKIADGISIAQYLYNFSTTYPNIPTNTKIYSLNDKAKEEGKKEMNNIFSIFNYDYKNEKSWGVLNNKIRNYYTEHPQTKPIEQNINYINKRNPLLTFCQNEIYTKNIDEIVKMLPDYANNQLCIGAIYKNNPIIFTEELKKNVDDKIGFNKWYKKYLKYKTKYLNLNSKKK
jgi:hypothetical protein